ncbi:MAG: D-tyrosyl-tRNA(Tyr) deacylase [Clostridia bacterium]|nr:D-tyrosyl-tRNA(Tyr) deacylase [Clostridia bacterium]MBQ4458818.1 D-tyrosyl-tRNA(Tyr) deacylase [Clostridia bacterium]MBQ5480296.1 D-tyrosyl-tRNA(Tyr) deacylase [Clostridia bacterium]MBQ6445782.1 D-tyrosyl-tRNA(Tyr) deacylase [Clostridia bacterium]MBQ6526484.1 D-tyrosyl-tRNA(Tyr) deacylase [Clostridia bacterium]
MKAVIQRVTSASVVVEGETLGAIDRGFLILLGVHEDDTEKEADLLAKKVANLRVFEDDEEKMNLSMLDCGYSALVISQFTLLANTKKGNRPSFIAAARPEVAIPLYERFMEQLKVNGVETVEHGEFGADMAVSLVNDGPVTIVLDTDTWRK